MTQVEAMTTLSAIRYQLNAAVRTLWAANGQCPIVLPVEDEEGDEREIVIEPPDWHLRGGEGR